MIFITLFSFILLYLGILINLNINETHTRVKYAFGSEFNVDESLILNAGVALQTSYCVDNIPVWLELKSSIRIFYLLIILQTIGNFTSSY